MTNLTGSSSGVPEPSVRLIEDDPDLRDGLKCLLDSVGIAVCDYGAPADFLRDSTAGQSSCIVVDIRLPGMSGIDLIKHIRQRDTLVPIIVMTAHADVPVTIQAFKLGALDFLMKPFSSSQFLLAVNQGLEADRQRRDAAVQLNQLRNRVSRLNLRDWDLIDMLRQGYPNKRMAVELGITERAVEMRRSSLLQKTQSASLPELIELVTRVSLHSGERGNP